MLQLSQTSLTFDRKVMFILTWMFILFGGHEESYIQNIRYHPKYINTYVSKYVLVSRA